MVKIKLTPELAQAINYIKKSLPQLAELTKQIK